MSGTGVGLGTPHATTLEATDPPTPHTPDNGDDDAFQQREPSHVRFDIILVSIWALLVTCALAMLLIRKARERRDPTTVSIFDLPGRRQLRAQQQEQGQRQLELQDRARHRRHVSTPRIPRIKLTPEEMARRAQKLREAYLDTFQRNQVQLTIRKEDMSKVSLDSPSENVVEADVDVDDATDMEAGEAAAAVVVAASNTASGWQPTTIQSGCAICLDPYEVGDAIVWSANEQCRHAFHRDCVLDYFLHLHQDDREEEVILSTLSAPCPCCRQSFCQPINEAYHQLQQCRG